MSDTCVGNHCFGKLTKHLILESFWVQGFQDLVVSLVLPYFMMYGKEACGLDIINLYLYNKTRQSYIYVPI